LSVGQNATATAAKRATKKVFKASTRILTGAKIFYNRFKHGYCHCGLKRTEAENNKDDIVTKGPSQLHTPMIQSR